MQVNFELAVPLLPAASSLGRAEAHSFLRGGMAMVSEMLSPAFARDEDASAAERRDVLEYAVASYREALRITPDLRAARRQLAVALCRLGYLAESLETCRAELEAGGDGEKWLTDVIVKAMESPDLSFAGDMASIWASLHFGSEWYHDGARLHTSSQPDAKLSVAKLRHDLDQFCLLREIGVLDDSFDQIIDGYSDTLDRVALLGNNWRAPLTKEDELSIGRVYGRIVHIADAPRLERALSTSWDRRAAQRLYLEQKPGILVIDDFLTSEALDSIHRFCLESTVWSGNRYGHGRLGSIFFSGFNCPLLLQIAEEIRDGFPDLIGRTHPLRQLWGFKYTCPLPADSTIHADFAAVNVNFWITPEEANLDDTSGGMLIYDVDAPLSWNFSAYNEGGDLIRDFLNASNAGVIRIPYRQNRAVIFNSDLFHATEQVNFKPDYRSHRINVTMLYGERQLDDHYPPSPHVDLPAHSSSMWRSAAFARSRH